MKFHLPRIVILATALLGLSGAESRADIAVRISIKIFLDAAGNRPSGALSTNAQLEALLTTGNTRLAATGRGYYFVLSEPIVEVSGQSAYFSPPDPGGGVDTRSADVDALDAASAADPVAFARRSNAVNCYFNARNYSAICSFPASGSNIMLFGQTSFVTTLLHECGHFFDLIHTHEGDSGTKGSAGPPMIPASLPLVPGDSDECPDTEPDHNEWDLDDIAVVLGFASNAVLQASGNTGAISRSARIWGNLMSYHSPPTRSFLSSDQMDRWSTTANLIRSPYVSGRTWFVSTTGNDIMTGTGVSQERRTLDQTRHLVLYPDDVILLKTGVYHEALTIDRPCTLRAKGGPVTITSQP